MKNDKLYVARNADGAIYIYESIKPLKDKAEWLPYGLYYSLPYFVFPEVKWEDKEPRELIIK